MQDLVPFESKDAYIRAVRYGKSTVEKDDLIITICRDRSVLDIGCIDHSFDKIDAAGDQWLHARIRDVSTELVGLDILPVEAGILNAQGFDIRLGDAETFDLERTFDIIVAGDIVEHMTNIGLFLESVGRHMGPESICVLTTPNPFNVSNFLTALRGNWIGVNPQHTVWLDPKVMFELVDRGPLEIVGFQWVTTRFSDFRMPGLFGWVSRVFSRQVVKRRPVCRSDFAVLLTLAEEPISA